MITPIWIFSKRHRWWTNGVYQVTEEVGERWYFSKIQDILYMETGFAICKDTFERFDWRPIDEMPRRTPGEIAWILNEN